MVTPATPFTAVGATEDVMRGIMALLCATRLIGELDASVLVVASDGEMVEYGGVESDNAAWGIAVVPG